MLEDEVVDVEPTADAPAPAVAPAAPEGAPADTSSLPEGADTGAPAPVLEAVSEWNGHMESLDDNGWYAGLGQPERASIRTGQLDEREKRFQRWTSGEADPIADLRSEITTQRTQYEARIAQVREDAETAKASALAEGATALEAERAAHATARTRLDGLQSEANARIEEARQSETVNALERFATEVPALLQKHVGDDGKAQYVWQDEKMWKDIVALHDKGNELARKYGIVFQLPAPIVPAYRDRLKLPEYNGNDVMELPLPATYVINKSGKITYAFLDADYKKRAEPAEVIEAVKAAAQ